MNRRASVGSALAVLAAALVLTGCGAGNAPRTTTGAGGGAAAGATGAAGASRGATSAGEVAGDVKPTQTFAGPDDAFLTPRGRSIITNDELSDTIAEISLGSKPRIRWEYGHAGVPGSSPGYLSPLPDGGVLVTEIGGWVDRIDRHGKLVWSIRTPTGYPSDAQPLPGGNVLVAGFDNPGHIYVITPKGRVIWTYGPPSGPGALDQPSLALPFPHHMIAATDDYGQRVVIIDRRTKRIVWQYGHRGVAGSRPGYLDKPDGLDLIR